MPRHLLVVEGAHDAALFGRLLVARGFQSPGTLEEVPLFWKSTIPRRYPIREDLRLDRVISFPEIYSRNDDSEVGIAVANGESELLRTLRSLLDMLDAPDFASIAVVLDTDWAQTEAERFAEFRASTAEWNHKAVGDDP